MTRLPCPSTDTENAAPTILFTAVHQLNDRQPRQQQQHLPYKHLSSMNVGAASIPSTSQAALPLAVLPHVDNGGTDTIRIPISFSKEDEVGGMSSAVGVNRGDAEQIQKVDEEEGDASLLWCLAAAAEAAAAEAAFGSSCVGTTDSVKRSDSMRGSNSSAGDDKKIIKGGNVVASGDTVHGAKNVSAPSREDGDANMNDDEDVKHFSSAQTPMQFKKVVSSAILPPKGPRK